MNNAPGPYRGPADSQEDEEVAAEDEDDMGVIETYSNYMPTKLKVILLACFTLFMYIQFYKGRCKSLHRH